MYRITLLVFIFSIFSPESKNELTDKMKQSAITTLLQTFNIGHGTGSDLNKHVYQLTMLDSDIASKFSDTDIGVWFFKIFGRGYVLNYDISQKTLDQYDAKENVKDYIHLPKDFAQLNNGQYITRAILWLPKNEREEELKKYATAMQLSEAQQVCLLLHVCELLKEYYFINDKVDKSLLSALFYSKNAKEFLCIKAYLKNAYVSDLTETQELLKNQISKENAANLFKKH